MKLLLYCTKNKENLWSNNLKYFFLDGAYNRIIDDLPKYLLNGKIVAECDCEMEELELKMEYMGLYYCGKTVNGWDGSLCEESQWDNWQLLDYLGDKIGNKGYAIHISNLDTYADPKKINDYVKGEWIEYSNGPTFFRPKAIKSAPKNMTFIWSKDNGEQYLFIPVKPEQLCKVLNKECSIIIKKRVPKELR